MNIPGYELQSVEIFKYAISALNWNTSEISNLDRAKK